MSKNILLSGFMVVFACLVLASLSMAFDVTKYLYATETSSNVQPTNISAGGTSYTLYTISGKYAILVRGENIVQSQDEISSVLKASCFSTAYPQASDLDDIKNLSIKYNESRNAETMNGPGELRCLSATGQNIIDCTDTSSCQAACSSAGITQGSCGRLLAGYGYPMVDALVEYANSRHDMNGNTSSIIRLVPELKAVSSPDQLNFDAKDKIDQLYNAVSEFKAAGTSMSTNKVFIHYLEGGYYLCPALNLDNASIDSAFSKATTMKNNAACFGAYSNDAKQVLNNTLDRLDYYYNVRQKEAYQTDFTNLMGEYNSLTENATSIISVFNASEINDSMAKIESYAAAYYTFTSAQNYDSAGEQVANIRAEVETLKSEISDANAAYLAIGESRSRASDSIDQLNMLIDPADYSLLAEKSAVMDSYNSIEAKLTAKVSYSEVSNLSVEYDSIVEQSDALIEKKRVLYAAKVSSLFSDFARGISLATLNAVSEPLGVREEEKRTWMSIIPLMAISMIDILLFAIISILFFVLVWKKTKAFLRSKILVTWAVILVFIVLLVLGLSFALNSLMMDAIGPTSFFEFNSNMQKSSDVFIFTEYASGASTAAIGGCADKIEAALNATGKNVTKVDVVDGVCREALYSECLTQVGGNPVIKLRYAKANSSTSFYTFYKIEAIISGDAAYFDKCAFTTLLK